MSRRRSHYATRIEFKYFLTFASLQQTARTQCCKCILGGFARYGALLLVLLTQANDRFGSRFLVCGDGIEIDTQAAFADSMRL